MQGQTCRMAKYVKQNITIAIVKGVRSSSIIDIMVHSSPKRSCLRQGGRGWVMLPLPTLPKPDLHGGLMTYYLLPTTYYLLPTTYYLLPTTYCLLPTAYCLLPTTHYLLPSTYYSSARLWPVRRRLALRPRAALAQADAHARRRECLRSLPAAHALLAVSSKQ